MRCIRRVYKNIKLPELKRLIRESLKEMTGGRLFESVVLQSGFNKVVIEKCEDENKMVIYLTMFPNVRLEGAGWYLYTITVDPEDRMIFTSSTEYPLGILGPFEPIWARVENEAEFRSLYNRLKETWNPKELIELIDKLKSYEILPI